MKYIDLGHWLIKSAKWVDTYYSNLQKRSVRPNVKPGEFSKKLAKTPPEIAESMEQIFNDFKK